MKLFKIIANENQLKIIQDALESYARLGIGQLEVVLGDLGFKSYEQFKDNIHELHTDEARKAITVLKQKLFKMSFNASYSMHNDTVHENFKVAYDIFSTIKHKLINGHANMTVSSSKPDILSKNGVIEIELIEDAKKKEPEDASRNKKQN